MKIQIAPYNEGWAEAFQNEAKAIMAAQPESGIQEEHIGSTSAENVAAKTIIDFMIGIPNFVDADHCIFDSENQKLLTDNSLRSEIMKINDTTSTL